eukprot:364335-Chlamydomonas_euryale.AAC.9
MSAVPLHMWDLGAGAAAGTAAVLISMPFDCVKTYMQVWMPHFGQGLGGVGGGMAPPLFSSARRVTVSRHMQVWMPHLGGAGTSTAPPLCSPPSAASWRAHTCGCSTWGREVGGGTASCTVHAASSACSFGCA